MRQVTVNLYQFGELSDRAKERARDWWRSASTGDDFSESLTEDFADILKACGYDVSKALGQRTRPAIYWDLSPSSAGFDASWSASRVALASLIADRPVTYQRDGETHTCEHNARLVPLLVRMAILAQDNPDSYGGVDVGRRGASIGLTSWQREDCRDLECECDAARIEFDSLSRELAAHFAWELYKEWEYANSDEYIDETITVNEYEFTEDGERA